MAGRFIFQRHIALVKPKRDVIDSTFLSYVLESPDLRRQADKAATGLAQKTVTLEQLKAFSVPVPPLALQHEFADQIQKLDALESHYHVHLAKLDALFASLQHRAFAGEL
jgi:type I restriction enzyme, S subunit